jgi:hypothetical protein
MALQCAVQVLRPGRDSLPNGVTQDISSSGFYFLSSETFVPGEQFSCLLEMPKQAQGAGGHRLGLKCRAEVVRIQELGQGNGLGVACRIADYRVVHSVADVSVPARARSF